MDRRLIILLAFVMLVLAQLACDTREIVCYPEPTHTGWRCPPGTHLSDAAQGIPVCRAD